MDSSKVPAPQQQKPANLFCDICHTPYNSLESLNSHYYESKHMDISRSLSEGIFGYVAYKPITSLYRLFLHPKRKGAFIGLQYLKTDFKQNGPCPGYNEPNFTCFLCGVVSTHIFLHIVSPKHQRRYIDKDFSFLFGGLRCSNKTVHRTAVIIDKVEGYKKFKDGIKNLTGEFLNYSVKSSTLVYISRQTLDKIVEQLQIHGITFKNPYGNEVPQLQTGSLASGTNEKMNINTSVPSEPSAASEITSRQVDKINDKPQIHRIEFKDACRNENDVPCLQAGSRAFAINVNNGKRPLLYAPLTEFKRCKPELPSQHAEKPVPVEFSFSDSSLGVPAGKNVHGHNSLQENKLRTTNYVPPVNEGMAPKPMPSLYSSHIEQWASGSTRPPSGEYSPSWPPAVSFYQNTKHEYAYSDQSLYKFANKEQASSVSDFGKANAFEGQTWRLETGHLGAQHLQTLGATGGSVSSFNVRNSLVASLKHCAPSLCGYNSLDSKELISKSLSPSGNNFGLNQEPGFHRSHGNSRPPEGLLPITTSSHAQTSQSTNSRMPANAASMLSPHTLKILQGRDPESVISILKRLSEYCPELQQVNISLLVDVLFETGALS